MQQPGTFIEGKYEILGKIREGGMGAIYKVRHRLLDEVRVIKVMKPHVLANAELKQRFVDEAKTATRLKHPNICTIHDFALDEDGTAYLVMEFIDGVTLAELVRNTSTPIPLVLEIAQQALLALGYLHRRNVVHRDIAPDNLMLTTDEEGHPLIKLIDLGIAKALDRPSDMTSTGVFLGKLKYASPEQYGALPPGEKIDGRSDLYCLGVVIYELLTGTRPFVGETPAELLRAHLFQPPIPFDTSDPEGRVPQELRAVIGKALEKKREDRYATAEDFHREIAKIQERIAASADPDSTVAFVSKARAGVDIGGSGITPSAQDRLDRRFGAHSTPSPSSPRISRQLTEARPMDKTRSILPPPPEPQPSPAAPAETRIVRPKAARRVSPALLALAAIAVIGVALAVARLRGGKGAEPAATEAAAAPAAGAGEQPADPTPRASEPTAIPAAAAPVAAATEPPAEKAPVVPTPRPAPPTARPRPTQAASRRPAEVVARAEPTVRAPGPSSAPAYVPPPVQPTAAPRLPPTAPPEPAPPAERERATAPAEPRGAAQPTDADRIRDVLRRWERAQNSLDADAYARVFPGVDRSRVQAAFAGFQSQTVTFDQIRVDVAPGANRATARLHEKRVAVPRVGAEQRAEGNRTVQLRKDGDTWVIAAVE